MVRNAKNWLHSKRTILSLQGRKKTMKKKHLKLTGLCDYCVAVGYLPIVVHYSH